MKRYDHKEEILGTISFNTTYVSFYKEQRDKKIEEISEEGWEMINTILVDDNGEKTIIGYFKKPINLKESLLERYK